MKPILLFLALSIFCSNVSQGQECDAVLRLNDKLFQLSKLDLGQEVTILTDKHLYRPGETIWMKGFVWEPLTHRLSLKSLEISVQLTDDSGLSVFEGKFPLNNGVANFNFHIPNDLHNALYHLIAWTPAMEDIGPDVVFKKGIYICRPEFWNVVPTLSYSKPIYNGDQKEWATLRLCDLNGVPGTGRKFNYQVIANSRELLSGKGRTNSSGNGKVVFLTPSNQYKDPLMLSLSIPITPENHINMVSKVPLISEKVNISFFPEGGNRVFGIDQRVVYRATDQLGNPVSIKGEIINESGDVLTKSEEIWPGSGVFHLSGKERGQLRFHIISEVGKDQVVELPRDTSGSLCVSVDYSRKDALAFLLQGAPDTELSRYKFVMICAGKLVWSNDFEMKQSVVIQPPSIDYKAPIGAVAIFNSKGVLVGQRLFYTGEKNRIKVSFHADKWIYKKGESGEIKVTIVDNDGKPVRMTLLASLADRYAFPDDFSTARGMNQGVEFPLPSSYELDDMAPHIRDCFLLSNHLKGFDWDWFTAVDPSQSVVVKDGGMRVSGRVVDANKIPVPDALVNLTTPSFMQFNALTDHDGAFEIHLPMQMASKALSVLATDKNGRGSYHVILNRSFKEELSFQMNRLTLNSWFLLDQLQQSRYFQTNRNFFVATSTLPKSEASIKSELPYWNKYLNNNPDLLQVLKSIRAYDLVNGKIVFRGVNSLVAQDGASIVVDGVKLGTDAALLSSIDPHDVADIRISLEPHDMATFTSLNSVGVIEIITKQSASLTTKRNDDKAEKYKSFIAQPIGAEKYDLITTLQWIPNLYTNAQGEAVIPFKTGGISSDYLLNIAGINDQGDWVTAQVKISVE